MVRGIDRTNQENKGSVLQSTSSGGLNVMSSALSLPLTDSPSMLNTEVNQRGNVQKRRGSQTIATVGENNNRGVSGASLDSIKLRNLPSLLVSKVDTSLIVFSYQEGLTNNLRDIIAFSTSISFTDVFDDRAQYVKPDTTQTAEEEPRIIFTTGVNPPVQLKFVQSISFDISYDSNNNESTITFTNENLANADDTNIFLFDDGTDITDEITNTSFSSPDFDVTVDGDRRNSEMNVVFVSWQWWAEASSVYGNKLYQRKSKFNSKELDRFVTVPTELLTGIRPLRNATDLRYPLIPTQSNSYGSYASPNSAPFYDYTQTPTGEEEYVLTESGQFNLNIDTNVQAGLSVVAFGSIRRDGNDDPTDEIEPIHFHRGLPVPFNGTRGIEGQNLRVVVGDTIYFQSTDDTSSTSEGYYLKPDDATYHTDPITATDQRGQFIDFTADDPTGVAFTELVEAINREPKFLGSNASSDVGNYGEGTAVGISGLWEFCDYAEGSFPRTVSTIQGRLVFGGTPKQPLTVAVSEVEDTLIPGEKYRNFQTLLEEGNTADPFRFELQANVNESITAIEEFNNQLFIFTQNDCYRLTGGDSVLSPATFRVAFQVGLGCVNSRCVERIENTMFFMNNSGVFDIAGVDSASQYESFERSLNVRDYFNRSRFDEENAWMEYDENDSTLYVGISNGMPQNNFEDNTFTAETLLIYNVFRDAWTEFADFSGRFFSIDGTVVKDSENNSVPVFYHTNFTNGTDLNGSPDTALISIFNEVRPVDYLQFQTLPNDQTAPWTLSVNNIVRRQWTYQLEQDKYFYPVGMQSSFVSKDEVFSLLPHREIEDVKVEIDYDGDGNYQRLEFNEDFVKFTDASFGTGIYLLSVVPDSNKTIRVTKLSQPEDSGWTGDIHPVRVWLDNQLLVENEDYVIKFPNGRNDYEIEFQFDASEDAVVEYGVTYDAHWYSPKFFRANMANRKRFLHWYGYFYNEPWNHMLTTDDANIFSGQDASVISETFLTPVGFNLAFNYNDKYGGYQSDSEVYGSLDLFWDSGSFDISSPELMFNELSRVVEPIIGASYNFQVGLLVSRATYFEMVGYQVTLLEKGGTRDLADNAVQNRG